MTWRPCSKFYPPINTSLIVGWTKAVLLDVDSDGAWVERPHVYHEFVTFDGANWRSVYDPEDIKYWQPDYWMFAPEAPDELVS
jgi:hypothetical protein